MFFLSELTLTAVFNIPPSLKSALHPVWREMKKAAGGDWLLLGDGQIMGMREEAHN